MRSLFYSVADALESQVRVGEVLAAQFWGEASDFIRINGARVRQAGRVERAVIRLRYVFEGRQAFYTITPPGLHVERQSVLRFVAEAVDVLRGLIVDSAEDPWLDLSYAAICEEDIGSPHTFDARALLDTVISAAGGADLVALCMAGPIARGFCSTLGSRLWFERSLIAFDGSIHLPVEEIAGGARKAVKVSWSGEALDASALAAVIAQGRRDAQVMARPVYRLKPSEYRVLLAPHALADLIGMLNWGGFSARAHRSGQSPLSKLQRGEAAFSPLLSIAEDLTGGLAPRFQSDGYVRPANVSLIDRGRFADWLVCPRSAREWGLPSNAASDPESPEALHVAPGHLADSQALRCLGTGVALSNLWYLNFSDRQGCRVTGMTRFACLWVEDGQPVAPIEAMRFDDSLFHVLGDRLEALGDRAVVMPSTDTYDVRSTGGISAPSALISAFNFIL